MRSDGTVRRESDRLIAGWLDGRPIAQWDDGGLCLFTETLQDEGLSVLDPDVRVGVFIGFRGRRRFAWAALVLPTFALASHFLYEGDLAYFAAALFGVFGTLMRAVLLFTASRPGTGSRSLPRA